MRRARAGVAPLALALALGGCAGGAPADPVAWWHQQEGGRIAQARPAPPLVDAPYPLLSTVPARPPTLDAATRARIARELTQDRSNAAYAAAQVPLAMPAPTARPAAPAAGDGGASATMAAASAAPAPPAPSPRRVVAAPAAAPGTVAAAMPGIPLAPPPPPDLPGVPRATRPKPAPVAPPPGAHAVTVVPGQPVAIAFPGGSAALPPGAEAALAKLAATRGDAAMRVQGFGDAGAGDVQAQAEALPLAFARADSIANALARAGVPQGRIRLSAAAQGHGGLAAVAD